MAEGISALPSKPIFEVKEGAKLHLVKPEKEDDGTD